MIEEKKKDGEERVGDGVGKSSRINFQSFALCLFSIPVQRSRRCIPSCASMQLVLYARQ